MRINSGHVALLSASAVLLTILNLPAIAEIYTCRDSQNQMITSDRPIAECANLPMRQYSNAAIFKQDIAAPLTTDQKKQKAEQDKQKQAQDEAARKQRQQDRLLLSAYQNEAQLESARQRDIQQINAQANDMQKNQKQTQQELIAAHKERQTYQNTNQQPPAMLGVKIQQLQQSFKYQQNQLQNYQHALQKINLKYDNDLKRFRELNVEVPVPAVQPKS